MSAVALRDRNHDGGSRAAAVPTPLDGAGTAKAQFERSWVPNIQYGRILAAMVEVAREQGAGRVTVSHVVARSGVSRRTFYEMFDDRDACFLAALELAIERGAASVVPAFERARGDRDGEIAGDRGVGKTSTATGALPWREQIRAGLVALLEFLDEEPGLGGLCVVDALGAGPAAQRRRAEVVRALVDAVAQGRGEAKAGLEPTRLTAEGVVGGVLGVLYSRFAERDPKPMSRLLNPLMAMIVLPYLGPVAAATENSRPTPKARRRTRPQASNPIEGLHMRLTYRTIRVLGAIREFVEGGAAPSNRQVADASGVHDQGQISKLLVRLERLGLIENAGATRGEPNAWRLTERGREVERAVGEQPTPEGLPR